MNPYAAAAARDPRNLKGRGNAKSAGTGDMPIPGLVTSRRQYRPQRPKVVEEPKKPLLPQPGRKAARRHRSPTPKRDGSPPAATRGGEETAAIGGAAPGGGEPAGEEKEKKITPISFSVTADKAKEASEQQEKSLQKRDEEERQRRREQEERWRQLQLEREAKAAEEARAIEEAKRLAQSRAEARKKNLAGMFALDNELDDEVEKQEVPKQKTLALAKPQDIVASMEIAPVGGVQKPLNADGSKDPISLRASLADPAAARMHNPGDVAKQFQLLAEMKRRYRGKEFGGPEAPSSGSRRWSRSRSRRRRRSRSRSTSRSKKYDSVWIRSGK